LQYRAEGQAKTSIRYADDQTGVDCGTDYSHSIINEPSKLLICKPTDAAPQKFTVIFTVKVLGTSIGAGFRAIRPKATFRDLSTSIESHNHFRSHRRTPV